jgi:signal transduction histidine kinase
MPEADREFESRLEQAKLDAIKELAYGASHEINNPLANISARAQTLLRDEKDPERRRALEAIHQQSLRAHEMISDLMLFARPPRLDRQSVDVVQIVRQVVAELSPDCERRHVELSVNASLPLPLLSADAVQLAVAIQALGRNALEAIGRRGHVEFTVQAAGDGVQIAVADDGPGIPDHIRPHIFEPFFSGREAGRGLGFGLSKAWRIITQHGGRISAENGATGGARFVIELPTDAASS